MTSEALDSYGWRIAFLIGAITLPFGLWMRTRLPETLHGRETGTVMAQTTGNSLVPTIGGARVAQTWEGSVSRTDDSGY